jgi:hypothetical protein
MPTYSSQAEIDAVIRGFELCTTDKTAFKHQDHLTVAVCYLRETTVEKAIEKMREALLRFVDHHKVDPQKYNETITVFWFQMVAEAMGTMPAELTCLSSATELLSVLTMLVWSRITTQAICCFRKERVVSLLSLT